jgi:uncharacterized protein
MTSPAIAWLDWNADSFGRARSDARPVLLSLAPTWCRHSQEMHRTSYADPRVVALVDARFVPIRVDPDRRPDIAQRYGLGGWPTTAFLTPDGQILGGGTFVEADRFVDVLQRVYDAFNSGRHAGARPDDVRHAAATGAASTLDQLVSQVFDSFDVVNGGFGSRPKFPHTAPIRLALELYKETGSAQLHEIAVRSLDAMGWGRIYDEEDGGFFRYARDADWRRPSEEKLLDVNASLLSLYVQALDTLQLVRYGERAEDLLRYLQTWLADPLDGGWAGSQRADARYYAPDGTGKRVAVAAPPVDRTVYTDWNAMMVSAALQAGEVLGDESLSAFAIKSLEHVVLLNYTPGGGVAHYFDGSPRVRGLLDDQVTMAVAQMDAFEATGNIVYQMMAEELALYAIRTMWDGEGDGFFDRATDPRRDVGLLRRPLKPFSANCLAATMLGRVARAAGSGEFRDYAARTLAVMSTRAAAEGPLAAEYVLAVRHAAGQ